jgi:hypothetical protein
MSGLLDAMSNDFSHRIAVRRGMMAHLRIFPTDSDCTTHREALRTTLMACARCPKPDVCESWVAHRHPGLPLFCLARETFLHLERTLAPPGNLRHRA